MIIKLDELKSVSQVVLSAVDSNEVSVLTETLELVIRDSILYMNVTNREYYVQVKLKVDNAEDFHATVNANLFLKLISQITTDNIELNIADNFLIIKGNGNYKLPLIFDGDELLSLPEISIGNITTDFNIESSILNNIYVYNSKQLSFGFISKPVQKMYYIDEQGAITFTNGACINEFSLEKEIKVLFNARLVRLFKLFKTDKVHFYLGYDELSTEVKQTKVKFETNNIIVSAVLSCDDNMLNSVPVKAIRGRVESNYPYTIAITKASLLETINRLMLFINSKNSVSAYGNLQFDETGVFVSDLSQENREFIEYNNTVSGLNYNAILDINIIKGILDNCSDIYITAKFGDDQAFVFKIGNIYYVVPEVKDI